jgi:hypothetical protein
MCSLISGRMAILNTVIKVILSALLLGGSSEIAFGQAPKVSKGGVPVVTVCEALKDLSRYNGKSIVVAGRLANTNEGVWLGEDCERRIVTDGYSWDNIISTTYILPEVGQILLCRIDCDWMDCLL